MRLLDGAGPRGLGGIAPVRGPYVRPLLDASRAAVRAHLAARGVAWVEDATNHDLRFVRNRVRADVLPFLAARLDPGISAWLGQAAARARGLVAELEEEAAAVLARLGSREADAIVLPARPLSALSRELGAEVLRAAAAALGAGGARRGPGERALRRALDPVRPRAARLGGLVCERSGRWIRVGPVASADLVERAWSVPGALALPEIGARLEARLVQRDGWTPERAADRVAFDADRLPAAVIVRARRPGDRFLPWGAPGERRLKTFLIDAGVPALAPGPRAGAGSGWRDHLGRRPSPRPRRAHHRRHPAYPRGDTPLPSGHAWGARVRWPAEVDRCSTVRSRPLAVLAFVALVSLGLPLAGHAQAPAPEAPRASSRRWRRPSSRWRPG